MRTFLANPKMAPELVARIERSVRRSRTADSGMQQRFAGISRWSVLGVLPMIALGAVVAMIGLFAVAHWQERQQLESARTSLLAKVRENATWVTKDVEGFLPKTEHWVTKLAGAYEGDRVASELRDPHAFTAQLRRSGVYLRGDIAELASEGHIARAAAASTKDSFLLCLYERPDSRAENALLSRLRGLNPGGALVDQRTAQVYRLHDAEAGLRVFQPPWLQRVQSAVHSKELTKLATEFEQAPVDRARRATQAEVLIAVIDEPAPAGGANDGDHTSAHDVRVAMVDLQSDKLLLRLRRRVDPNALSPSTRVLFGQAMVGCSLSLDVYDAVEAGR